MAATVDGILFDNDALSLLSAAGLVAQSLAMLGVDPAGAFRLGTLTPMLRRGQIGRTWQDATRAFALQEAQRIQVWRSPPAPQLLDRFAPIIGIDSGEAVLYASLVEHPTYLLVSGDKRSMMALCEAPDLQDIQRALSGRVVCLEQILDELVEGYGALVIGRAFAPVIVHKTLGIVFSETMLADEEQCRDAIGSYIRDLKRSVGEGFLFEMRRT